MAQLVEDTILDASAGVHRPRNLDWKRAAALLYGDWGTSKAYVIGLAFVAAGFSSLPIILAVCALTGLVGINYAVICRHFPDGGGVYSAARSQGRLLAVVGALLLTGGSYGDRSAERLVGLDLHHFRRGEHRLDQARSRSHRAHHDRRCC